MSRLKWNEEGSRFYETGVDHGVFFPPGGYGTVWNGLISITQSPESELETFYIDGVAFMIVPSGEQFGGTIESYTDPAGFSHYDGYGQAGTGLFIGQQPRRSFGMAYRSYLGDDIKGIARGHKIHLIYNVMTLPSERVYKTLGDEMEPVILSREFKTVPVLIPNFAPTANVVIDNSHLEFQKAVENLIYGTAEAPPTLPTPEDLISLRASFA